MKVDVFAAKTKLSKLLDRAERGEKVIITRHGRPVAQLVCLKPNLSPRRLGLLRGRVLVRNDFDAPLPADLLAEFAGRT